jgi:phenylacetate-CoA ligase
MNPHGKYWNPVIETLPVERLRELQLKKFKRAVHWAYNKSPFYRRIYTEAALEPGDIKTHEDIRRVPKVEKDMLREACMREHCIGHLPPVPYGVRVPL